MRVCIIGGGGQVADGLAAMLSGRGHKVGSMRFEHWVDIPGVPRRIERSRADLDRNSVRVADSVECDPTGRRSRWITKDEAVLCDAYIFALPSFLAFESGVRFGRLTANKPFINISERFLGSYDYLRGACSVYKEWMPSQVIGFNSPPLLAYQPIRGQETTVHYLKPIVMASQLPMTNNSGFDILDALFGIVPSQIRFFPSFVHLAFENVNSILHAVQDIYNLRAKNYKDIGIGSLYDEVCYTANIISIAKAIVEERDRVAAAYSLPRCRSILEFDTSTYSIKDASLIQFAAKAIYRNNHPILRKIPRPAWYNAHGYEDIGWSLVPLESFARYASVSTPYLSQLIDEWNRFMLTDYRSVGRTMQSLGLLPLEKKCSPFDFGEFSWICPLIQTSKEEYNRI